jgi:tight adherence protein C
VWKLQQSPEAQLRKRLNAMIDAAVAEREKNAKKLKKSKPAIVEAQAETINRKISRKPQKFFDRVIQPIIDALNERLNKFAPNEIRTQLEDKIFRAGKMGVWDIKKLLALWVVSVVVTTVLTIFMLQDIELHPLQRMMIIGLGVFVGAAIPFVVLNSKIRQRQKILRKQLPEFLDLLCVSVQAGLSFDGAVSKLTKRMKGPLIDEFKRMQNDISLGMTHQYALTNVARRCDLEEVYLFTTSVIQAEKLGTSMTRTLKQQADNMRDRHRQYVKAEALKAPVKIIFPMVMFIFPSMFVVLLFPALFTLIKSMGGE